MLKTEKNFYAISNSDGTGTPSNFTINMNNASITNKTGTSLELTKVFINPISFSIDLNYFNISETLKNNKIIVSGVGIDNSPVTVTIPDGLYNGVTLQSATITALNGAFITWTNGAPISWVGTAYNAIGTFTFGYSTPKPVATNNNDALITLTFVSGLYDSRKIYGASANTLAIAYGVNGENTIISRATNPNVIDLVPINTLFIRSNIAKSFHKLINGMLQNTDILFVVNIGSNIGGTQVIEFGDQDYYQEINSLVLSNMNIRITDKENRLVNFASTVEVNFVFSIEHQYFRPSTENINKSNIEKLQYN